MSQENTTAGAIFLMREHSKQTRPAIVRPRLQVASRQHPSKLQALTLVRFALF